LNALAGPLVEAGAWIGDLIRRQRVATQIKTLQKTEAMLKAAGLTANHVPAKILVPLLEAASLEEDPEMQDVWAALLANAATDGERTVFPSFTRILGELVKIEAQMLDKLESKRIEADVRAFAKEVGFKVGSSDSFRAFNVHLDNLVRLQLCRVEYPSEDVGEIVRELSGMEFEYDFSPSISIQPTVVVTALGRAFVVACSPPKGEPRETRSSRAHAQPRSEPTPAYLADAPYLTAYQKKVVISVTLQDGSVIKSPPQWEDEANEFMSLVDGADFVYGADEDDDRATESLYGDFSEVPWLPDDFDPSQIDDVNLTDPE
jgi:hypothetical protein